MAEFIPTISTVLFFANVLIFAGNIICLRFQRKSLTSIMQTLEYINVSNEMTRAFAQNQKKD